MKFSLGPLKFQSGKESSFPILSMMNTPMKGSMTNTDQLGYQILQTRIYKYDSKTVSDVNMVPVSYEFIDIKGWSSKRKIL
jgi:putative ABC transport system permease protein